MSDPFAPIRAEAPAAAAATQPCSRCGALIDPMQATYSESGALICRRCEAAQTIAAGDARAVSSLLGAGISAGVAGLVSFCFNPFYLMSVLAILGGIGAIAMMLQNSQHKEQMAWRYPVTLAGGAIGIALGLFSGLLHLVADLAIAASM